ncbi:MAG: nuclear transport factor 2 family protein, partial [Gammaproteobacteria bacterium]
QVAQTSARNIAERYLAAWNERDPDARRAQVAQAFAPDATYLDPMMRGSGVDGIDAMIAAAQGQFPGCRFALHGQPDGHNDVVRFSWVLVGPHAGQSAAPLARGTDVATVDANGRLVRVTGFLDAT